MNGPSMEGEKPSPREQRALLALTRVSGVGPSRVRALLARFGTAEAVLSASRPELAQVDGVGPQTAAAIAGFDAWDEVDAELRRAERVGATLLSLWSESFPRLLRRIYDPPVYLWSRGKVNRADSRAFAIVGTRRCSAYGRRQARRFASELARRGFTIISGLAYGIDAAAHEGALEGGGRTIAILGSGVDRIYPSQHKKLARRIMTNGAVLSEYDLGAKPDAPNFPRRNRIISGMAHGTLVVEAHEKGGALITARLSVEQNREVFAVPSPIGRASGEGTNRLIQRGHAKLVLSVDDILDELNVETEAVPEVQEEPAPSLSGIERQLYKAIGTEPVHIDALCAQTNLDASTALVYLLSLEFKGLIRQMAGKQFLRA